MKKKLVMLALMAGMMAACSNPVFGEEKTESSEVYRENLDADLDGDGEKEHLTYVSTEEYSDVYQAHLEIYEDERLIFETMSGDDAYCWYLYSIEDEKDKGKEYLWAKSVGDNDFCSDVIALEYTQDGVLREIGDFMELSASDWDGQEMKSSDGWLNFRSISSIEGNKIQAEARIPTKRAGVLWGEVVCQWTEDGLLADKEMRPMLRDKKEWTAAVNFPVYKEPGSEEETYQVKRSDTVKLLSVTWEDNVLYLECENASGEKGWIRDREYNDWECFSEKSYFEESWYL